MLVTPFDAPAADTVSFLRVATTGRTDPLDLPLLAPDEKARMTLYRDELRAARFCTTRAALRRALAKKMGGSPEKIRLGRTEHGKPYALEAPQLRFSISYDTDCGYIAFCQARELGLDVQRLSPRRSQTLRNFVQRSGIDVQKSAELAQIWTRMEAYGKMTGVGLCAGLTFLLDVALGRAAAAVPHCFLDLAVADASATVCVEGGQPVFLIDEK